MPIDAKRFRQTLGSFATGVTVVAARDTAGVLAGMTASAVASLSLEPPMLLVCVGRDAEIHDAVVRAPLFSVTVLAEGQEDLAMRFATKGTQHFDGLDVGVTPGGLPRLRGAIAHIECRRDVIFDAGDHTIVTGVVEWADVEEGRPLCYFRSRFTGLAR